MFRCVDCAQLAYSVQKFTFDFLSAVGVFEVDRILPDTSKGQCEFWIMLLICLNFSLFMLSSYD
jgi:hypothetical protein